LQKLIVKISHCGDGVARTLLLWTKKIFL